MNGCAGCGGCEGCSGCGKSLELTAGEISVLRLLSQIPFLPVARGADLEVPVCLELPELSGEEAGLILRCLEKRGLISLDYEKPLMGFAYAGYENLPVRGSFALTQRGQQAVELLEVMGCQ